ncbi:MAG: hypothetical protein D6681_16295 [Calditrichaeota bacterium]|nr:MAG: hypothetical protein D6681_16295 [Calditrichota bacterium]
MPADWAWLRTLPEGQFFERKSCYDRSRGQIKRRDVRRVARDIAETLSAMANADGGTLVLGIEDDGTPTGIDYPPDRLEVLLEAPRRLVRPPLRHHHYWVAVEGYSLLVFEVDWSPEVHQLTDGRYLLRVNDSNQPFPAEDIYALKEGKRRRLTEMRFFPEAAITELDNTLLDELRKKTDSLHLSNLEILQRYRLIESRNGKPILTLAALLLFAKDPLRWHGGCYIDFVKWEGRERRFGTDLNIVKRERIEAPLLRLIAHTFEAIKPHIRERQRLVDLFFEERFEYPPFAWQEAIINAVAHRDYGLEGTPIEVWIFDDRMEIRSPGKLVEPVTLERLQRRERIHASRNPRLVRVLTDWGYMRELGEGVPRMFEAMEREGLNPPQLKMEADVIFTVTLYNALVYPPETLHWLRQYEEAGLTSGQKRLLAYAHAHGGNFTSRVYQKLAGVDIYTASRDIKDLIRKGIVQQLKKGGRVYRIVTSGERNTAERLVSPEFTKMKALLKKKGYITNRDVRTKLQISRAHATRLLQEWVARGWLSRRGEGRGAKYVTRNASS